MAELLIDTETIHAEMRAAAVELQAYYVREEGSTYRVEDLERALLRWLVLCVEALAEDVMFHTVEGDRAYAFNRPAFEREIERLQPTEQEAPAIEEENDRRETAQQDNIAAA